MATRVGSETLGVVEGNGDAAMPDSPKGRFVQKPGANQVLIGSITLYKMRAKDTGASFVFWISADPNANYPGTPVGSIVDKQIAAIIPVSG